MPLHSIQRLSPTAALGLWHLTETPAALWEHLPPAAAYQELIPATADVVRQAQWLAGRVLVQVLADELIATSAALVVHNDLAGRPWLAGNAHPLAISLSHSGAWVAALLTRSGRVGVDVEMVRSKAQRLAGRFLAAAEWAEAQAATGPAPATASTYYTLLWSAKETLYKLAARRGVIFKTQLSLSPFGLQESGEILATLRLDEAQTRHRICYSQPAPGYVLTYCYEPAA